MTDLSNISTENLRVADRRLRRRAKVFGTVLLALVLAGIWTGDWRFILTAVVAFVPWSVNYTASMAVSTELKHRRVYT